MKLLLDMNLTPRWVEFLGQAHIHAVHWSTIGRLDAADLDFGMPLGRTSLDCT